MVDGIGWGGSMSCCHLVFLLTGVLGGVGGAFLCSIMGFAIGQVLF